MSDREEISIIKKNIKSIVLGTKEVDKRLKEGKVIKVWLSSNVPGEVKEEIDKLKGDTEIVQLGMTNEDFAVVFKKQYSVSVAGLVKSD